MNKFKVGDKVRRVAGWHLHMSKGDVGTVRHTGPGGVQLEEYNDPTDWAESWHSECTLELAEAAAPQYGSGNNAIRRFPLTLERDPSGLPLNAPGAKADAGKLRPTLVIRDMANALQAVIKIATDGAAKYTEGGWLQVPNGEVRYDDADLRHMLKRYADGPTDADSGSLHLAHEAWNALAKLELALRAEKAQAT